MKHRRLMIILALCLAAVLLTLLCCKLLKKGVSPIAIILALFAVGIAGRLLGFM